MKRLILVVFAFIFITNLSLARDNMSLSFLGGLAIPTGDFGDLYDTGIALQGIFEYRITPSLGITASGGYLSFSESVEYPEFPGEIFDRTFSTIPLLAGVRYYIIPDATSPYLNAEVGLHMVSWERDEPFLDEPASASGSDIGFSAGGGLLLHLNPDFQIDARAQYNSINTETDPLTYFSGVVGIRILL